MCLTKPPKDPQKASALLSQIGDLIDQRVLVPVPPQEINQGFYSHVFVVKKPSGKFRLILNLKLLNKWVTYRKFRMETIFTVRSVLPPNCFMASLDLRDAYLHIPIQEDSQKYLRIAILWGSQIRYLQFRALPFGLSSSPRIFTKVLAEALAPLRLKGIAVIPYLDDLLFFAPSKLQLQGDLRVAISCLKRLGWLINQEKSHLIPTQALQYLGFLVDSVSQKVFLTEEKVIKVKEMVTFLQSNQTISIRSAMAGLGLLVATIPAVPWARAHFRCLQANILDSWDGTQESLDGTIHLSSKTKRSLWSWKRREPSTGSLVVSSSVCSHHHGCQCLGLGGPLGVEGSPRMLGEDTVPEVSQLEGVAGSLGSLKGVRQGSEGPPCTGPLGQYSDGFLPKQAGRNKMPVLDQANKYDHALGRRKPKIAFSGPSKRGGQPPGGLSESTPGVRIRMVTKQGDFPDVSAQMGSSGSGLVRQESEHPGPSILFPREGGRGKRDRRFGTKLGFSHLLRLPPIQANSSSPEEIFAGTDHIDTSGSVLAEETMVLGAAGPDRRTSPHTAREGGSAVSGSSSATRTTDPKVIGLASEESLLKSKGLSDRVIKTLLSSRKKVTQAIC
ncbi:uncharacterized protein LOC143927975 [Lithobates pipiens]